MKKFKYILIAILATALVACEKEIEFDGEISQPQLVIDCRLSTDSLISANITKSKFFLESDNNFEVVENADVSLYINDIFKEKLNYQNNGKYISIIKPLNGDKVKLIVSKDGNTASCQTIVSPKSTVKDMSYTIKYLQKYANVEQKQDKYGSYTSEYDTIGYQIYFKLKVTLRLTDNGSLKEYYQLSNPPYIELGVGSWSNSSITFDGVLNDNNSISGDIFGDTESSNKYNIFSDEIFNGKNVDITFMLNGQVSFHKEDSQLYYIDIPFKNLNEDLYRYYFTRSSQENSDDLFSEPVQIYSNVTNGIGIMGASTLCNGNLRINVYNLLKYENQGSYSDMY